MNKAIVLSLVLAAGVGIFSQFDHSGNNVTDTPRATEIQKASEDNEKIGSWSDLASGDMPGEAEGLCYLAVTESGEYAGVISNRGLSNETFYRIETGNLSSTELGTFNENVDRTLAITWNASGNLTGISVQ